MKPIAYDFDARFDVGTIGELSPTTLHAWKQDRLAALQMLVGGAIAGLEQQRDLIDWFDHCARLSETASFEQLTQAH